MRTSICFTSRSSALIGVISILLSTIGCGKSNSLTTIPVQGRVTWKGSPLTTGDIAFHPIELEPGSPSRLAIGRLDAEGHYTLSTVTHGDGAQPGEYAVVISDRESGRIFDAGESIPKSQIPRTYSVVGTTPLKASVPSDANGPLQFDFDLKEQTQ